MKQSFEQKRLVWTVGAMVLAASLIFGKFTASHTNSPAADSGTHGTQGYTYHGASRDYSAVPHPWSLTYASPGSDYYMRDRDRQHRWEDEERKEQPRSVPEWARPLEITLASE